MPYAYKEHYCHILVAGFRMAKVIVIQARIHGLMSKPIWEFYGNKVYSLSRLYFIFVGGKTPLLQTHMTQKPG